MVTIIANSLNVLVSLARYVADAGRWQEKVFASTLLWIKILFFMRLMEFTRNSINDFATA